ncbi:MAG TPA: ATP-binding protein, partial [Polyangiaceae bacterium]|nr:ATP-binding protein [Polyangiaceae bacterium]
VNEAFERTLGISAKELIGSTANRVFAAALEPAPLERYASVVSSGEPVRIEARDELQGRCHQVIAFRVGDRQFATLLMDVTERKRAEEALRNADRHKNEFLAILSHELRNPLAPIKNGLYVLERAVPGSEQARRALAILERQVGQLARLVEDLLDVTRISRGKVQLQLTTLDLGVLLRRVAEDHASDFEERGLDLTVDAQASVAVRGDAARLTQVLGNLLQNAAKFTPSGGRVHLALEVVGERSRVRVSDTGYGMDAETLARLFEPFMQAESSLARTNCGLGLGLACAKGIVELHGGVVQATSPGLGMGSEFVVELPVCHEPVLTAPSAAKPKSWPKRVLVVEDNADAADSLREALAFGGHQVEVAYKGADGIARARSWRPDVLLCDIGLPDIDGHEIARTLRRDPSLRSTFLVALTGYALPDDLKRSSEAGFDEHLAKPPSLERIEQLLSTIRKGDESVKYD